MKSNLPSTLYFLPCVLIVLLFLSFFFSVDQALAQCDCYCTPSGVIGPTPSFQECDAACGRFGAVIDRSQGCGLLSQSSQQPTPQGGEYPLKDPLGPIDPITLAGKVINYVLGLLGAGVFVVFLVGGGRILFSAGNPKMVEGGRKTLVYAVIGLAVIFLSYAVLNFFFTILQKGAG